MYNNLLKALNLMREDNGVPRVKVFPVVNYLTSDLLLADAVLGRFTEDELDVICAGEESGADALLRSKAGGQEKKVQKVLTFLFEGYC